MKKTLSIFLIFLILLVVGCKKTEDTTEPTVTGNTDIPTDPTNVTPPAPVINNIQPTANIIPASNNPSRIQMNLTGLINPTSNQPIQLTYNSSSPAQSNIFVTEDGTVKGLKVTKVGSGTSLKADIVFTVDNSGSMGEEADSIAASIIKFANTLQASGLDVKFACVGFYGYVDGAINFTTAQALETYLNKNYGTSRTVGFSGPDSAALETKAQTFHQTHGVYDEDGVVGIFFADSNFSWRSGAQRVFVNFTDEPTQPSNLQAWSTSALCQKLSGKATVHTVWSGGDTASYSGYWNPLTNERPWDMSTCTGGTFVNVPYDATGLNLSTLPVTGALSNSYLVEFVTAQPGQNKNHTIIITIKETTADGKKTYTVVY